jgi:probable F420-dependent oxidoreductase
MRGRNATRQTALTVAQFAEDHGYHSIWASDHFVIPPLQRTRFPGGGDFPPHWREGYLEALTTLTYLAARTDTLRVGTSALVLPLRNPVQLARQLATLDVLSEGRAMLAVTSGYAEDEFAVMGVPFAGRGARLEEYVAVLKTMWRSTPATFAGSFFAFDSVDCGPLPAQGAALPIFVGGSSPASIRRAAQIGDGWHPAVLSLEDFRVDVARFRAELAAAGRTEQQVPITAKLSFFGFAPADGALSDGSPRSWITALSAIADLGVRLVVIDYAEESIETVRATLDRFEREVRPNVESQAAHPAGSHS